MAISNQDPRDAIDWGTRVAGSNTIEVYFAPRGAIVQDALGWLYTSEGMNDYEVQQFQRAFKLIESVANVNFVRVWNRPAADFVIGLDNDGEMSANTLGWMIPPGYLYSGNAMFNGRAWDRAPGGDLSVGGYGFVTIVHELLHGLGLAHPFDNGGGSEIFFGVDNPYDPGPALLNQGVFTTMSYASGFIEGPVGTSAYDLGFWSHGYEIGPSSLDIAVLQAKYGANPDTGAGGSTYVLPDHNRLGTGYRTIWDTGGRDLIEYSGDRDVDINLRPATLQYDLGGGGFISAAEGVAGGFVIAARVVIENARSGDGNDRLVGNWADNRLVSGPGDDRVFGRGGDDLVLARAGNDVVNAGAGKDVVRGGSGADTLRGGDGKDELRGLRGADIVKGERNDDRLLGGLGNDVLRGGGGDDRIWAGDGDDTIFGSPGDDRFNGGAGADTFRFADGTGHDTIVDFEPGIDWLSFDPALWGGEPRSAADIVAMLRTTDEGLIWRFGDGNSVLLLDLTDTTGLEASILV